MSVHTTRKCDNPQCDAVEGEGNHWLSVARVDVSERQQQVIIADYQMDGAYDACGEQCALQIASRLLAEGK